MNPPPLLQAIGNGCVALAALVFLLPLQRFLRGYADRHVNDDQWATPAFLILMPLWLLLMGGLLCMTASGGFDWLEFGRPILHTLTVGASLALAGVMFVFIALYIRPGFTPRFLYTPVIYLIPFTTGLLVLLSLNQSFIPGVPIQWLRWPWTVFTALSLIVCVAFLSHRLLNTGLGGAINFVHRILTARDRTPEHLARIATLDPRDDFTELLTRARAVESRSVREAATARLRTRPEFIEALAAELESPHPENAIEFLHGATLAPAEQSRLALPARTALERFIRGIPAPNFMPRSRQKELLKWGRKTFPVIIGKFTGSDLDFTRVMPAFEHALRPDDTRR